MKINNVIVIFFVVCLMLAQITYVFAAGAEFRPTDPLEGMGNATDIADDSLVNASNKIWNTVMLIFRIVAIACIIFAGIRYMYASADQRADIKQSTLFLVIGSILVFCGASVVDFIIRASSEIM